MPSVEIRATRRCSRPPTVTMHPLQHQAPDMLRLDATRQNKTGTTVKVVPVLSPIGSARSAELFSVDEAGARRLLERRGERLIFAARCAGELGDLLQVIRGLLAVALFELPQAVILPGPHMVRIGLQRALVPDLRDLVVAELAIGVTQQIGDVGAVVLTERLELPDRAG